MELTCQVQNYEWGKKGSESKVAQLQKSANSSFLVDDDLPYAELWMGTHINAPSVVKHSNEKLSEVILRHPEYLGEGVLKQFRELPFLFKVLSVNKALSIQAHPSKKHAEELHSQFPDIYKDPNHKPEMAIALTPFEALCGFRPLSEIKEFIRNIPELQLLVGKEIFNDCQLIQKTFKAVVTAPKEAITESIDSLLERCRKFDAKERVYLQADLLERLHSQFPYDNGILMVYLMNYLKLKPLEAIFLGANEVHAYLFGDCIECMACSDNVVRAGLTPKYVDVDTLCSMLIYKGAPAEEKLFLPIVEDNFSVIFRPPVPDFAVVQIQVPKSEISYSTRARNSASILLIISGQAQCGETAVVPGTVLFIPANEIVTFSDLNGDLLIYQAVANIENIGV